MSLSLKSIAFTAGVTVLVMFAANFIAARSPVARRLVKGSSVASVSGSSGTIAV